MPAADVPARQQLLTAGQIAERLGVTLAQIRYAVDAYKIALATGCRRGELLALTWEGKGIDLDAGELLLTATKGKRDRYVPLLPEAVATLRKLKAQTQQAGGPFVGMDEGGQIDRDWDAIKVKAEVLDVTIHDLRRTATTRLIQAGVNLPTVQKIMGHQSITTTIRFYNEVSRDDLRAGMNKLQKAVVG